MRVIARKTLKVYSERVPDAAPALNAWYHEARRAHWKSPADIKGKYGSASILKDGRVVFNIGGNKYRLVVWINFKVSIVYIRFVGTHKEYDKINAQEV